MFSEHYKFNISDDYYCKIRDYIPVKLHREQKHKDIIEGVFNYTQNAEIIDKSESRRRGSDIILLVNDQHYIWSSRTGMESCGNCIKMSQSCPEDLRFSVLSNVFKNVLSRRFEDIGDGLDKKQISKKDISIMSPNSLVLQEELSQKEIKEYYNEIGDLATELMNKYYECQTPEDLRDIVSEFNENKDKIFRDYINFDPTDVSTVINNTDGFNNWHIPDIDKNKEWTVLYNKNTNNYADNLGSLFIEINRSYIAIVKDVNNEETIKSHEYKNKKELEEYLKKYMKITPEQIFP